MLAQLTSDYSAVQAVELIICKANYRSLFFKRFVRKQKKIYIVSKNGLL